MKQIFVAPIAIGKRTLVDASVTNATTFTLLSPDTEDWVYEVQKN